MAKTEIKSEISLSTTKFQRGMAKAQSSISKFAKSGMASVVRLGAAFAGIGLVKSIVSLGLSAGETASKFKAVFGPAADDMNRKVQALRKTIPSTTAEMQNALSTFAAMAKGFGLNSQAANLFSVEMVKVAGDIASFHDLPIEEAFGKIRSAVSGEFEPMKQLGIVINEARLKQEGLSLAIWDGAGTMSAAQKALAVQSIMIRDMGSANGDAAATADSAANRVKFLRAELLETGTKIGTTALPAILALTEGLALLLSKTKEFTDFTGTKAGEMIYGPTDESLEKMRKTKELYDAQKQAVKELTAEGELYKQGIFEGKLWTKGLSEKLEDNKRKIKERTDALVAGLNIESKAATEKKKADEEAIKNAKDLQTELKKQIETETDPERKKALADRLKAYEDLLKAAGKLEGLQGAKPKSGGTGGSTKTPSLPYDAADANKSGTVTGREQRAKESADRKAASEARRAKTREVAHEAGAGERQRSSDRDKRFSSREAAAGLELAGNDTTAGRKPLVEEAAKQTKALESIEREIKKNP
tara:strand:- start:142 stop:1737 length:1596 start_codon:yes stop_codon:yes gene_type:complete